MFNYHVCELACGIKISLISKPNFSLLVDNAKFVLSVDFSHLPIWPSKPIYHLTSFRKLKNLIALCNFTMRNFFWPLDVTEFDMSHWSMFNFATKVPGWWGSPICIYAKKQRDIIISWALGLCLKYLLVKYPIYFFHKISKFFFGFIKINFINFYKT